MHFGPYVVAEFRKAGPQKVIVMRLIPGEELLHVLHDDEFRKKLPNEFCRPRDEAIPRIVANMILRILL